jgi:putative glutamine amidotransferase
MKIAVSQREIVHNNITYDCLEQGWHSLLNRHTIVPIPNTSNIELDFDMLILSGGNDSPNRRATETIYYNIALLKGIPILGVCHGAFVINESHGGTNQPIEGHHNTAHQVLLEGTIEFVNSYHFNSIATLGKDLESIAVCTHDNTVEAFKHKELPIWGLVWHPERTEGIIPTGLAEVLFGK